MTIIDRYMLRQFIQVFVICFCSLTGLYIVIDGFGNLDEFMAYGKDHGGLLRVVGEYYGYRCLTFFDRTSGVLTLMAAMFTVTWIQRHQELTALMAAGVTKARVVKPLIMAVLVISVLSVLNREMLIPRFRSKLSYNAQNLGGSAGRNLQPRYDNSTDVFISGAMAYTAEQKIDKPSFGLPRPMRVFGKQASVTADVAFFVPANQDHPNGYLFQKVRQPAGLADERSVGIGDRTILFSPHDNPWLAPDECFFASDVNFEQLTDSATWSSLASTMELIRGLRNPSLQFGGDVRVAIHSRMVQPILDITLLFLGLPLVLTGGNRNMFMAIGLGLALVLGFFVVVLGCKQLGESFWLSRTALAAWMPVMIFAPAAAALAEPLFE